MPRIKPGIAGCDARMLSIVLCGPPSPVIFKVKFLLFRWMWPRWFRWKETKTKVRKDLFFVQKSLGQRFLCLGFHFLFIFEKKKVSFLSPPWNSSWINTFRWKGGCQVVVMLGGAGPIILYELVKLAHLLEIDFLTLLCSDGDGSWSKIKHFSSIEIKASSVL